MIDLRSDTVTLPTPEMWEAMNEASLKDNTLEGDPTVIELEETAASLAGKEAGLFVCTVKVGCFLLEKRRKTTVFSRSVISWFLVFANVRVHM